MKEPQLGACAQTIESNFSSPTYARQEDKNITKMPRAKRWVVKKKDSEGNTVDTESRLQNEELQHVQNAKHLSEPDATEETGANSSAWNSSTSLAGRASATPAADNKDTAQRSRLISSSTAQQEHAPTQKTPPSTSVFVPPPRSQYCGRPPEAPNFFDCVEEETIRNETGNEQYTIVRKVGRGSFGVVALCSSVRTTSTFPHIAASSAQQAGGGTSTKIDPNGGGGVQSLYAVKILRPLQKYNQYVNDAEVEIANLRLFSTKLHPADDTVNHEERQHYVVTLFSDFTFQHGCTTNGKLYHALVCEALDCTLHEFVVEKNGGFGLWLEDIRVYAKQLFQTAAFLHDKLGACHTDFKHKNIMLTFPPRVLGGAGASSSGAPTERSCFSEDSLDHDANLYRVVDLTVADEKKNKGSTPALAANRQALDLLPAHIREKYDRKAIPSRGGKATPAKILRPRTREIRVIDFGNMTLRRDFGKVKPVNTRQFRAPEILLDCQPWDEKSDIWCLGCVLLFLYFGELCFDSHDDLEQLHMMQRLFGDERTGAGSRNGKTTGAGNTFEFALCSSGGANTPSSSNATSAKKAKRLLAASSSLPDTATTPAVRVRPLKWELEHWKLRSAEEIFDSEFRDFLQFLMVFDPAKRPSAAEVLRHPWLAETKSGT
ncbi:unnamed protein product [Amoebophrya sp. A120]|nr:unnamed protein product [Amoebophrya sp. A120]|eukprot:GSA120T00024851001.1